MPAISFHREFVDALLRCDKQQTTRQQTARFHVGDTAQVYVEQRRRITDKPLRTPTPAGADFIFKMIEDAGRYPRPELHPRGGYSIDPYYAHFLGTVKITETYTILPCEMSGEELEAWAWADGFQDFPPAGVWFSDRYGNDWMQQWWTVVGWHGWLERYFEPAEVVA